MNRPLESVALVMMAKAPPRIVERAIRSASMMVDRVVLVVAPGDPLITTVNFPMPIRFVEQEWLGYSATRTRALEIAGEDPQTEWVLMLDAYVETRGELPPARILAAYDAFDVAVFEPVSRWRWLRNGHLMRARSGFRWNGKLHEAMSVPHGAAVGTWQGLTIVGSASPKSDGGRTYTQDVKMLEEHLTIDPGDARAVFYLAQSLKDAGEYVHAFHAFGRRLSMGGFAEEILWSMLWRARLAAHLIGGEDPEPILHAAAHCFPDRAEPLHELSGIARRAGRHDDAQRWGEAAWALPYPEHARSFVDCNAYSPEALEAAGVVLWPAPRDPT